MMNKEHYNPGTKEKKEIKIKATKGLDPVLDDNKNLDHIYNVTMIIGR